MSRAAQHLLFFGLLFGTPLVAWLWIRWRLRQDDTAERAAREAWAADIPGSGWFDPCCGQIGDAQDVTHWMPMPSAPGAAVDGALKE